MSLSSAHAIERGIIAASLVLELMSTVYAQYTSGNQTNLISGVVSNWTGDYIVGSNAVWDSLQIVNGGILTNSSGYVGVGSNACNNSALVTGSGSTWGNTANISIGSGRDGKNGVTNAVGVFGGSSNNLAVSAGGVVICAGGNIGAGGAGVAGSPFLDSNTASLAGGVGGNGNLVVMSGPGSAWRNGAVIKIGTEEMVLPLVLPHMPATAALPVVAII